MSLIKQYLKDRFTVITLFWLTVVVFLAVSALYQLDTLPKMGYAALIMAFLGGCGGIYDYWRYRRHYQALRQMATSIGEMTDQTIERLPPPRDGLQIEYHRCLMEMYENAQRSQALAQRNEAERLDYYLMWAHQIKTPIAAIKLLIQNSPAQPNNSNDYDHSAGQDGRTHFVYPDQRFPLERELFKIESYVEMVLHYLRLDSIGADMVLKRYDVLTMLKRSVKKYALLFIDHQITMELKAISKTITTDEKWFSFIIEQLLSNAIKYTPAGTISIYLEEERLVIADTGIGIRAEDLPRIFERGFTGYNGRIDQKATGIGLYLSKQVADRLAVGIMVTSQSGTGTKVSLDLSNLTKG